MNYFSIQCSSVSNVAAQEMQFADQLQSTASKVSSALGQISESSALNADMRSTLNGVAESISEQQSKMERLSIVLSESVEAYETTEKNLINTMHSIESNSAVAEDGNFLRDYVYKVIGKAGYFGPLASFAGKIIEGQLGKKDEEFDEEAWRKESIDTSKAGFSILKMLSKWQSGNEELAKLAKYAPNYAREEKLARLVGLNCKMGGKVSTAATWGKRFAENVEKSDGIIDDFTKGGSKCFFAWAGLVVDGAINTYENYQEYKDGEISGERAFVETISETAVDFAVDWAIGTAVTAALAATPIGAPVLLVGACTVGVKVLLDAGCENLFGKNLSETVSDFYVDIAEDTMNVISDGIKVVEEFISETGKAVGEAVCKGAQEVVSGIGNTISDGWNSFKNGFSSVGQGFKTLFA